MMWGKMTDPYNQLSMGYSTNNNISRMGSDAHGFTADRVIGYAESHDEERLMYKNLTYGNSSNASHDVKDLDVALSRMSAIGAISLLVPGPKMIWHFGELGWDESIFTCTDGSVNTSSDSITGDCKLSTKPQPQWVDNWPIDESRSVIFNDWAKMIAFKKQEQVFSGSYTLASSTTLTPKLFITDASLPSTSLKDVVVLTNFDVVSSNISVTFPYTGTWYNLMDDSILDVTSATMTITIAPGQYKIYGNQVVELSTAHFDAASAIALFPNPSTGYFTVNTTTSSVEVFSLTGQLIKRFPGTHDKDFSFDVSDLSKGVYLVKATDAYQRVKTMKLVKE
jgi:hypothetical protein